MATFGYKAIDRSGKQVKGSIDADNLEKARAELKKKEFIVLNISEQSFLTKDIDLQFSGKPKPRDLSIMCRQFVSMTKAGVTIVEVLQMLHEQTENKKLKEALKQVRISVEKGETLADSFAQHPKVFPGLMVNMARAGEASGSLEIAMERLAKQFERSNKTQALIKKAMIYPMAVLLVAVVVTIVMLVKVIPAYEQMFVEMGTELPFITKLYVGMSNGLIHYWYILLPAVILLILIIGKFARSNTGKHLFGKLALRIPVIKNMIVKSASSLMARTLGTLIGAGVPLIEAVSIVSGLMKNVWFKEALADARDEVAIGVPLSRPIEACGMFPPMVHHMMRIGEESGNSEEMLDKLADYYDDEVEVAVQSLLAALEPLLIVVLALVVGGLLVACMAPMLTMYDALGNL